MMNRPRVFHCRVDPCLDDFNAEFVKDFYQIAIPSDSVARAIAYAIEQPANVDINEIVLRPEVQDF